MAEDETTFLCGYRRPRRYGTTSPSVSSKPSYSNVIHHNVCETDTIQGLALRYGSSMTEIKRLNKLWSNDSLHLKETLLIPVQFYTDSPTSSAQACGALPNGVLLEQEANIKKKRSGSETVGKTLRKCSDEQLSASIAYSPSSSALDKSDHSVSDLLTRIDQSIKITTNNVKKLERESTIDKVLEQADSGFSASSSSVQSFQNVFRTRSPSPTEVRTEGKRNDIPMERLRQAHDKIYQL